MILGHDVLTGLGIKIDFGNIILEWDSIVIPMKDADENSKEAFAHHKPKAIVQASDRLKSILDAKYEKANLKEVAKEVVHLKESQQQQLHVFDKEFPKLFDGSLGKWHMGAYDIELHPDATPYHARAFPIPKAYTETLKVKVDRLVEAGVLRKVNCSEWVAPTFIIPKKDGSVRFISDFQELNKRIKRIKQKPSYLIPKIQDLLLNLEGFQYTTSLDLNMGYYHIKLSPQTKELCTIIIPWGKYEYQRLPMGLCNSPGIFQEKMSTLMQDLDYVRAYIDDILVCNTPVFRH
jgi:Reverse transcriptase (RNA-dependent DNA polymerase)